MEKLIYYYRIIHLQVGGTYIVALSLMAFIIETVILIRESKSVGEIKPDSAYILKGIFWLAMLSPIGFFIARVIGYGEPNNTIAFGLIPAAACGAYGAVLLWRTGSHKPIVLAAAAAVIILMAGQLSGFGLTHISTDSKHGGEEDVILLESAIEESMDMLSEAGYEYPETGDTTGGFKVVAPSNYIGRIGEYRSDLRLFDYSQWLNEEGTEAEVYEPFMIVCPFIDSESGLLPDYTNIECVLLTSDCACFLVRP
ncbi:MAG: hypothetical protein J6N76_09365 [Lachnospiraceae bacterium]|nr:hypothetical protein [Lachnospiraceae bacterium]